MSSSACSIVANAGAGVEVLTRVPRISRSTCLARMSTSMFTVSPPAARPRVVRGERLGDQRDGEAVVAQRADGQADAVDRDRALLDQVAHELAGRRRSRARARCRRRVTAATVAVPSTWPCTMWPPSRSPARSASSRLTGEPALQRSQRGARERLGHRLGAEAVGVDRGRRQADAVDGDRVARRAIFGGERACGCAARRRRRRARRPRRSRGPRSGR